MELANLIAATAAAILAAITLAYMIHADRQRAVPAFRLSALFHAGELQLIVITTSAGTQDWGLTAVETVPGSAFLLRDHSSGRSGKLLSIIPQKPIERPSGLESFAGIVRQEPWQNMKVKVSCHLIQAQGRQARVTAVGFVEVRP